MPTITVTDMSFPHPNHGQFSSRRRLLGFLLLTSNPRSLKTSMLADVWSRVVRESFVVTLTTFHDICVFFLLLQHFTLEDIKDSFSKKVL